MQQTDIMTADELFEMGKGEHRYELINGRLIRMAPTGSEHSAIGATVIIHLGSYVLSNRLGRVYNADIGYVFSRNPDTVRSPDASFIRQDRLQRQEDRSRFSEVLPDLAIEVISPSDRLTEVTEKAIFYIESGVRLVWVINPRDKTVIVYTPDNQPHLLNQLDELDGGDVLPDFRLAVSEIFS